MDPLNSILGLWAVVCVTGAGALEAVGEGHEASSDSVPLLRASLVIFVGVCLAVVSVFAMACCSFFRRRRKEGDDDPETMAETGNARHGTAGNDVRMNYQSLPYTDVAVEPMQTTSFNLQTEIVRVDPVESNGPHRQGANAAAAPKGTPVVAPDTKEGFKDRSHSLASLGTIGKEAVEAVTLVSRDNNGIGLTVVNGGRGDGIFVRNVQPDGPADESRRLHSGDRIVSMAICMERMSLDDAQTLFRLARFYPVELHFVKRSPEVALHPQSSEPDQSSSDLQDERGRSLSTGCLPSIDEDHDAEKKLQQDRTSSSLTNLPLQGQISRWSNEVELSPEIKFQNKGSTFDEDIRTMSQLASGDDNDEELDAIAANNRVNAVYPSEGRNHPGDGEPPVAVAGLFAEYEAPGNRGVKVSSDGDSEEEDDDADHRNKIGGKSGVIKIGGHQRVLDADEFRADSGNDSYAEPTWQSDFKIELPHLGVGRAAEGSRTDAGSSESVEVKRVAMTSAFQGDGSFEGAYQNDRDVFKTGEGDYDRESTTQRNSSFYTEKDEDQNLDEKTPTSISNVTTSEGASWHARSPDANSDMDKEASVTLFPKNYVDKRELSFGVKAERRKDSFSDQGHESTKEGTSDEEEETGIKTGVVMEAEAMSGFRDPSIDHGSSVHAQNTNERAVDSTKASSDFEERNVSAGSHGLRRSPGEGDVKVVRKGQTESYYERFCETVETGLPGRVIDLDVVDEGHEVNDEEDERAVNKTELGSEVNEYEEKVFGSSAPNHAALSVNGPSVQESNSVPQASGNVSPEIVKSHWTTQSPPHAKESKGKVNTSIGGRLKGFFSPKKGSKDKDKGGDIEETSVRANDFAYSPAQLSTQRASAESVPQSVDEVRISPTNGAPNSAEERNRTGFGVSIKGAPPQGSPWESGVVLGNGGQDGRKEEMEETVEETWARSYSVNDGGISANTSSRVLEVSALGKGRVDGDETGTEQVVESSEWQSDTRENDRKLYTTGREKEEEGMAHKAPNGSGKSHPESDAPGFVFDGTDFSEFYYGMAFYGKDQISADGVKESSEDVEHKQKEDNRLPPVGKESKVRVNGVDDYAVSEASSLSTSRLQQQVSSDDEDEIISYPSDAQTRSPGGDSLPQERIAEYGKEKRDDAALPTSNRSDVFEFLDLNQFSLEPLELPSWESLGLSSQQNGIDGSSSSYATKYKTKEITLKTSSEDQNNNNALIDSSNA